MLITVDIIIHGIEEVKIILGVQPYNSHLKYRPIAFLVKREVPRGFLVYNTLTGSMIFLRYNETPYMFLIANWFYVPDVTKDTALADRVRKKLKEISKNCKVKTYTIFPTTDCNAKCFYCFEIGRLKIKMSTDTAIKVARYIEQNSTQSKVIIRWFGGEPLCNQESIDLICSMLKGFGVQFESKMATNGFLFSAQNVDKAFNLWHLKQVQVTLDGTRNNYNRIKNFDTNLDAFEKVLDNINLLASHGIKVTIRLNVDYNNIDDQIHLVEDVLLRRFANCGMIFMYSHFFIGALAKLSETKRKELFEKKKYLRQLIANSGVTTHKKLPRGIKFFRCVADDGISQTIMPNGEIGLCEHYTEDHFISSIDFPQIVNEQVIEEVGQLHSNIELCDNCAYYPLCIRLKICPDAEFCCYEIREENVDIIREEMFNEYINKVGHIE